MLLEVVIEITSLETQEAGGKLLYKRILLSKVRNSMLFTHPIFLPNRLLYRRKCRVVLILQDVHSILLGRFSVINHIVLIGPNPELSGGLGYDQLLSGYETIQIYLGINIKFCRDLGSCFWIVCFNPTRWWRE